MSLFCMLWAPLFLLFWLPIAGKKGNGTAAWAFFLGGLVSLVHYIAGSFVRPSGFALSRWIYALVDIVLLPSGLPFLVAPILILCRRASGQAEKTSGGFDYRVFALVWLIPEGLFRSILWSGQANPLFLILVPLLWTSTAVGIPLFMEFIRRTAFPPGEAFKLNFAAFSLILASALGIAALPLAAATCFWAFFGQRTVLGAALLIVIFIPKTVTLFFALKRHRQLPL
jgi:hypothetical protein